MRPKHPNQMSNMEAAVALGKGLSLNPETQEDQTKKKDIGGLSETKETTQRIQMIGPTLT